MQVRDAQSYDIPEVLRIAQSTIPEQAHVLAASTRNEILVARDVDVITGFLVWNFGFFGKPFCWLLGVALAYRRRGYADKLLEAFEDRCRGRRVYTSTNKSNLGMHGLLLRRGYEQRGVVDVDPGDAEVFYSKDVSDSKTQLRGAST